MESSSSMQSSMQQQQPSSSMAQSSGDVDFRQQIVNQPAQAQAQQNRPMDPRLKIEFFKCFNLKFTFHTYHLEDLFFSRNSKSELNDVHH